MYTEKRRNKYHASSSFYDGYYYSSKLESGYAQELDIRKKGHDIKDWERQVKIELSANGYVICNYYVDFRVTHNDDSVELVETKGMETETWRLKRKLLEALYLPEHPECRYTVIKQSRGRMGYQEKSFKKLKRKV